MDKEMRFWKLILRKLKCQQNQNYSKTAMSHPKHSREMKKVRGYYPDCYVLSETRTTEFIFSFLDKFLPNRREGANEYEVPQYSDSPTVIFNTAIELIDYLTIHKDEVYTIYWPNTDESEIKGAMCFFTNSGQVIIGIYCDTLYPDTTIEDNVLSELKSFCGNQNGYIAYEETAPYDTQEFLRRVKNANA